MHPFLKRAYEEGIARAIADAYRDAKVRAPSSYTDLPRGRAALLALLTAPAATYATFKALQNLD